jgi:hypothetical protein
MAAGGDLGSIQIRNSAKPQSDCLWQLILKFSAQSYAHSHQYADVLSCR